MTTNCQPIAPCSVCMRFGKSLFSSHAFGCMVTDGTSVYEECSRRIPISPHEIAQCDPPEKLKECAE